MSLPPPPERSSNEPLRAFLGHHKSGSTWVLHILRGIADHLAIPHLYSNGPHTFPEGTVLPAMAREGASMLFHVNADYPFFRDLEMLAVHVVRDPRDVTVSGYFSHRNSHPADDWPALQQFRRVLQQVDEPTGLLLEMEFLADVMGHLRSWPSPLPGVLEVRFETMIDEPEPAFRRILDHLRLSHRVDDAVLRGLLSQYSFEALSGGRARGTTDPRHHYRRGIPGDWRQHFGPAQVWAFETRYGDLLRRYGYEQGPDWG